LIANVRLAIGRAATVVSAGGDSGPASGQSERMLSFWAIAASSSPNSTPEKLLE
jgi:hypothetical protein